jgi:hypothetical protein
LPAASHFDLETLLAESKASFATVLLLRTLLKRVFL